MQTIGDGYAMNRIFDTAAYGVGYGNQEVNWGFHNSRDINKGHCDIHKDLADKFEYQNIRAEQQTSDIKAKVDSDGDQTRENVQLNTQLSQQLAGTILQNITAMELRAERRADRVDDKICNIEKQQAVTQATLEANHAAVMTGLAHQNEVSSLRAQLNDKERVIQLQTYGGCRPTLAPNCGTSCGNGNNGNGNS